MEISLWIIWLALTFILVIIELLSTIAITLCLATGTFAAFIAALAGVSLEWQLFILAVATVATIPVFPRLIKRYRLHRADAAGSTGMDALIGRRAIVTTRQEAVKPGRIRIDGDNWQAVDADGGLLETGDQVEVVSYDSIILRVRRCQ